MIVVNLLKNKKGGEAEEKRIKPLYITKGIDL